MVLFHHRMPTSTINTRKANHPFSTRAYFDKTDAKGTQTVEYILIHNGHISNATELFVKHQEQGIEYFSMLDDLSFTDSEALLWDFALTMEGKQKELTARGGNAMMCLKLVDGKPKCLYFGRNTNPIWMTKDEEELHLSSTGADTSKLRAEGKTETMVKQQTLYTWYFGNHHLKEQPFIFPSYLQSTSYVYKGASYPYGKYDSTYADPYDDPNYDNACNPRAGQQSLVPDHLRLTKKQRRAIKKQRSQERRWQADHTYTTDSYAARQSGVLTSHGPTKLDVSLNQARSLIKIEKPSTAPVRISKEEVQTRCTVYLAGAGGNYYQAYTRMKADLEILRAQKDLTELNLKARGTLLRAMTWMDNDPDWKDRTSISPLWEEIWQKRNNK